jgi:hypothetical protein
MARTLNAVPAAKSAPSNFNRADAFSNVILTHPNGNTEKVGYIAMNANKDLHAWMIANKENIGIMQFSIDLVIPEAKAERQLFNAPLDETTLAIKEAING